MSATTTPRERPILFSGPMVRAILDGRKTQTRRVVPIDRYVVPADSHTPSSIVGMFRCPYGAPGDTLWVRETHWIVAAGQPKHVRYRADGDDYEGRATWCPSIFMPRWASRLTLRVAAVRVERLQAISEEDAVAEGVHLGHHSTGDARTGMRWSYGIGGESPYYSPDARGVIEDLWDSINGKRAPWASNPWVWAVSFERIEPGARP